MTIPDLTGMRSVEDTGTDIEETPSKDKDDEDVQPHLFQLLHVR